MDKMNQIEEHLYLGNYLSAIRESDEDIKKLNITTIISVICTAIPKHKRIDSIMYSQIEAGDCADQDLLSYFPETIELIKLNEKTNSSVLVHCMAGASRSATFVIAYIMQKYKISYSEARDLVKSKRPLICPNYGFVQQLELFEKMTFTLDANHRQLRRHLIQSHLIKDYLNDDCINQYFERLSVVENLTPNLELGLQYNCNNCGTKLFNEIHVLKNVDKNLAKTRLIAPLCHKVYIEPQKWMLGLFYTLDQLDWFIKCIKCAKSIAKFQRLYKKIICNCDEHWGIKCLKIQMLDNSFNTICDSDKPFISK